MFSRPQIDKIAFLGISWYGLLIFAGILIGLWIIRHEERRLKLPKETAIDFALLAIPLGIAGARLYSVLFRLSEYQDDWLRVFNLREGGLAIPGAILGGMLAAFFVSRRRRISFLSVCDMAVLAVILAQAIGRWGNYINIEAYGFRISDPAWQFFPIAIEAPVGNTWYWHMATFFYESVWDLLVFAALFLMRRRLERPGDLFCWYAVLYGVGRTVIEGLRIDSLTIINEFVRISQILCALSCVAVAVYYYVRQRRVRRVKGAAAHDALLLASVALGLAACFVGEFERGAYGNLFTTAQALVLSLLLVDVAIALLRAVRRCPLRLTGAALWVQIAFLAALLLGGVGRAYADNVVFVTLRQIPSMLQIALCAGVFYFAPFPPARKKHTRSSAEPA